jgi:hypothetical protein
MLVAASLNPEYKNSFSWLETGIIERKIRAEKDSTR